jgi:hypothetical protein
VANDSFAAPDESGFRLLPRWTAILVVAIGLLDIVSWCAHWRPVLQMVPNSAPMQHNTAVGFVLLGLAMILLTTSLGARAPWPAGAAALLALVAPLQYFFGWNLGIDQMFLRPFFEAKTAYPGRMSPLAAVCFVVSGSAIVLAGMRPKWAHRHTVGGLLACTVGVIALVALLGFVFGIESAYSWGSYSKLAVATAMLFLLLGVGLLAWFWREARREDANFLRWLPIAGSVTLMLMITFVSSVTMADLGKATFWRKHTIQVILSAQAFEENLVDLQRGVRGYVTLGDTAALASYQTSLKAEPAMFDELVTLTADNPIQQRRLRALPPRWTPSSRLTGGFSRFTGSTEPSRFATRTPRASTGRSPVTPG